MRKIHQYFKNDHSTKNLFKYITDEPNGDAKIITDDDASDDPNTDDDDAGFTDSKTPPYSLRNRNDAPDAADDDSASPYDDAYPDSVIYYKLKRKSDPR